MDYFQFDSEVITNDGSSLQTLGFVYDKWVEKLWRRRTVNCEMQRVGAPYDLNILQPDVTAKLFINNIFHKKVNAPCNCTLLDIKKILAKSCRIGSNLRYFFLNWSHEISAVVKDEVTYDDAIVPTYNNDIIVYVEYNS